MQTSVEPLLDLRGVSKTFGGSHALSGVDLSVEPGEVHVLLGQNGSGKSTLLRILAGFHEPNEGTMRVRGEAVPLPLPVGAYHRLGISFVHQDLGMVPALSVAENMMIARLLGSRVFRIRWGAERRRVAETLARHGLERIDPRAPIAALTPMQRALVAIVRAVDELHEGDHASPLLVLDEPTAFLPRVGIEQLFKLVRELVQQGGSVLFVTHDLDEVDEVGDRVTVLRDGRRVGTRIVSQTTTDELVELIIGYRLARSDRGVVEQHAQPVQLRARHVTGQIVRDVDVEARAGEVLGVTGLIGSGFEELGHLLFGSRPGTGELELAGRALSLARLTPRRAMEIGMAFVPADRAAEAAIGELSVADNVTMPTLKRHRSGPALSRRKRHAATEELGTRFGVTPNQPGLSLSALSGGNQQKAMLAKWLSVDPRVLVLDQPTQGVDVGAREQIFAAIRAVAHEGTAVICVSADYEELAAICTRVLVVARGRITSELSGDDINKDTIAERVLTSTSIESVLGAEP